MTACYCDVGDWPRLYAASRPMARATHKCSECGRTIQPRERYERVRAIWGNEPPETFKTCCYCLAMRDLLEVHAKCFCWLHRSLRDDIDSWVLENGWRANGLAFALGRLEVERRRDCA